MKYLDRHRVMSNAASSASGLGRASRFLGRANPAISVITSYGEAASGNAGYSKAAIYGAAAIGTFFGGPQVGVVVLISSIPWEVSGAANEGSLMLDEAVKDALK